MLSIVRHAGMSGLGYEAEAESWSSEVREGEEAGSQGQEGKAVERVDPVGDGYEEDQRRWVKGEVE